MAKVRIPFQEMFREAMLSGRKTATTRTRRYGKPGDTFEAFGATFELWGTVWEVSLEEVLGYYKEEGFDTADEFMDVWKHLHPRMRWQPQQRVFLYHFKKVEGTTAEDTAKFS